MNNDRADPETVKLRALLREHENLPDLPAGFQRAVWHRIERAEAARSTKAIANWLDSAAGWFLRPRHAIATVAVVLFLGAGLGSAQSLGVSKQAAQERYLSAVAPNTLR
jgi:hypothetical protein